MSFKFVEKVELCNGLESRLGASTIYDDKLNEMQAHIYISNGGGSLYLNQEQLDEFINILSNLELVI